MGHTVARHERQALKMDDVAWGGVSGDVRRELRCDVVMAMVQLHNVTEQNAHATKDVCTICSSS
jgi:hypothetical protein